MKVLIVDDDITICGMLSRILKNEGYETVTATDEFSALSELAKGKFDVLIIDYRLKDDVTGFDVLDKIQSMSILHKMKIIMVSGYTEINEFSRRRTNFGTIHFLSKPFPPQELLDIIKK